MTKEALDALNALIKWFGPEPCADDAVYMTLCALRAAAAKPEQVAADERYWAQVHEPTQDSGPTQRAYDLFFSTTRRLEQELEVARAGYKVSGQMLDAWNEWAKNLTQAKGNDADEQRAELAGLVELGRKSEDTEAKLKVCSEQFEAAMSDWGKAAELLGRIVKCADDDGVRVPGSMRFARAIEEAREMLRSAVEAKPVEVSAEAVTSRKIRRLELDLASVQASRVLLAEIVQEWNAWAKNLTQTKGSDADEQRAEISRLVELGREAQDEIWRWAERNRELADQLSAKPACPVCENKAVPTPEPTKAEAELQHLTTAGTRAAPPWQMQKPVGAPEPGPLTEAEKARLDALAKSYAREPGEPLGPGEGTCDPVESKASELETMLTALMGKSSAAKTWGWIRTRSRDCAILHCDDALHREVTSPEHALAAINARFAELAPEGWTLYLYATSKPAYVLEWGADDSVYPPTVLINADLGARIAEALEWIAAQDKPEAAPAPDEPITPPAGVEEHRYPTSFCWVSKDAHALCTADGIVDVGSRKVPLWLPRLRARARQVFRKEDAK